MTVLYRVNCGNSFPVFGWESDAPYLVQGIDIYVGANAQDNSLVPECPADVLRDHRWATALDDPLTYQFDVSGYDEVDVSLYFSESYHDATGPGWRYFDIDINGVQVADNYDAWDEAGARDKGSKLLVHGVDATSGTLTIQVYRQLRGPMVSGILVEGEPPPPPPPPPTDTLRWHVYVDWDGDGSFDVDEGNRLQDLSVERGRERMFDREGLVPMGVGVAKVVLDNYDGRFDAWNSGSPLYPNVMPNRDVWIRVTAGGVTYDVMRGTGQEVATYGYDEPRAELPVEDGWRFLARQDAEHAVELDMPTGTAIASILFRAGWPWGTNLDAGSDTIPYWWAHGEAARQIHDLVAAEFGFGYITANGSFRFIERRNQFGAPPVITVTQSELLREPEFSLPSEGVRNTIRVFAQSWSMGALGDVWTLGEVQRVRAGQSETLWAEFDDPVFGLIVPQANTDYTAHTLPSGGTDMTSDIAVTMTYWGQLARLTITNNNDFRDAYLTLLKVRGQPLTAVRSIATADDAASQANYGTLRLEMDYAWVQSHLRARNEAEWLLSWLSTPSPAVRVVIEDRPALQFGYDLGTVLELDMPHVGLDATFQIGKIQHQWLNPNGSAVRTIWNLEPVRLHDFWVLGTSLLGLTTRLGF